MRRIRASTTRRWLVLPVMRFVTLDPKVELICPIEPKMAER
jgi:hypothetical protein